MLWIQISVLSDPPVPGRSPQNIVLQLLENRDAEITQSSSISLNHTVEHAFRDYSATILN